mgnify:CR=1 FL=1
MRFRNHFGIFTSDRLCSRLRYWILKSLIELYGGARGGGGGAGGIQ